jgi:hypothetical protein
MKMAAPVIDTTDMRLQSETKERGKTIQFSTSVLQVDGGLQNAKHCNRPGVTHEFAAVPWLYN